jgi:hypothetical protein
MIIDDVVITRIQVLCKNKASGSILSCDFKKTHLHKYIRYEVYGNTSVQMPLCFTLSDFDRDGNSKIIYIFYTNESYLGFIKNDNCLDILRNISQHTKIFYINLNNYISKILKSCNFIESAKLSYYKKSTIEYSIPLTLYDYKLRISKSFNFSNKYMSDFNHIPELLKKDLIDLTTLENSLSDINVEKLNYILKDIYELPTYDKTNDDLIIPLSKFNLIRILYNNFDKRKTITSDEIEMFDSLKEYNPILQNMILTDKVKIIQLQGVKFILSNQLLINDGFTTFNLVTIPSGLKEYILSICKIENIKNQIEKLILTN